MLSRLEMLHIFYAAAESSSFKEAASRLGRSPQVVTRVIKSLEDNLGELLFHRNTRQIRLTEFGSHLIESSRESVNTLDAIFRRENKQADSEISGLVRITAPTSLGQRFLLPVLSQIAIEYPQITIDLRLSNVIADVVSEQIDIGIRIGFLRDSNFIARVAGKVSFLIVGSPELVAKVGEPLQIKDLTDFPTIAILDHSTGKVWQWFFADNLQFNAKKPAFITNDPETELETALAGVGYAQIPSFMAAPYLADGRLIQVLETYKPEPWDLYIYRPQRSPTPQRIRLIYDQLLEVISNSDKF